MRHKRGYISSALRLSVYTRDNFTCQYCGAHAHETKLEIDHIIPVYYGGNEIINNLRTSCTRCNRMRLHDVGYGTSLDEIRSILRLMIPRSSIINWETGKRAPRTVDIDRLALALGVSPHDLIGDYDEVAESISDDSQMQLQSKSVRETNSKGFAYWGGVLDAAQRLAEAKNLQEINVIAPLLKIAYEALVSAQESAQKDMSSMDKEAFISFYAG